MVETQTEQVEFEAVTLRIPKKIMDYLRAMEPGEGCSVVETLEHDIVEKIRADVENLNGSLLIEKFNLEPAFTAILGDGIFK